MVCNRPCQHEHRLSSFVSHLQHFTLGVVKPVDNQWCVHTVLCSCCIQAYRKILARCLAVAIVRPAQAWAVHCCQVIMLS